MCTQGANRDARSDRGESRKPRFCRDCERKRPRASPCGKARGRQIPSTGISGSLSFQRKTMVFGGLVLKSYPVSAQAVAFGGDPLGNETATVAAEDENRGAAQGRGSNTRSRWQHRRRRLRGRPVTVCIPVPHSPHRTDRPQQGRQGVHRHLEVADIGAARATQDRQFADRIPFDGWEDAIPALELCPGFRPLSA